MVLFIGYKNGKSCCVIPGNPHFKYSLLHFHQRIFGRFKSYSTWFAQLFLHGFVISRRAAFAVSESLPGSPLDEEAAP